MESTNVFIVSFWSPVQEGRVIAKELHETHNLQPLLLFPFNLFHMTSITHIVLGEPSGRFGLSSDFQDIPSFRGP